MTTVTETERLSLRQLTTKDADFLVELMNSPGWIRYIGDRGIRNAGDAAAYIHSGPVASYRRCGFGLWLVTLREGTAIGICGLLKREELDFPDLGYAFLPHYTGCGYAREAAAAVLEYARGELNISRTGAVTDPENERSLKLLSGLGFEMQGLLSLDGGNSHSLLLVSR